MTINPATVAPNDTLSTAVKKMSQRDVGALPVVDPQGALVAMITDRDICMATWSRGCAPDLISVAEVMSPRVTACRASDSLEVAQSAMRLAQVRRLPVVDDQQRLLGVISLADMATAHERADRQHRPRDAEGLAATLASVCRRSPSPGTASVKEPSDGTAAA
jgi:CBS domain-containing protein